MDRLHRLLAEAPAIHQTHDARCKNIQDARVGSRSVPTPSFVSLSSAFVATASRSRRRRDNDDRTLLNFTWDGEAFTRPAAIRPGECDRFFVVGERYALVEHHERSTATHNHYFAALHEAWQALPDHWASSSQPASTCANSALIKSGYHDQTACYAVSVARRSHAVCERDPSSRRFLDCDHRRINRCQRFHRKEPPMRAMGKKDFQESKEKVL